MNLSVVILAAGLGTRMKSTTPKVLHHVLGIPMLEHVAGAVEKLKPARTIAVIGNGADRVKESLTGRGLSFALQKQLLGTGDALMAARKKIGRGTILVLNGDGPLIRTATLKKLLTRHKRSSNVLSFLSFRDESMKGYGRIIRDASGRVTGIVEDKHATDLERSTFKELNGGVYVLEPDLLKHLSRIKKNSSSGEYYLTDLVGIVAAMGKKLDAYDCPSEETRGINTREELFEVSSILRDRVVSDLMKKGVTFLDPRSTIVHVSAAVGADTVVYPNTYIEGSTRIGKGCTIYPGSRIVDSVLGNGVAVKDNSLIEESRVGDRASIGPCAHLRPLTKIGRDVKVGNFVEIKKSVLGNGSKASHLTYLGDADVGEDVNIGAGTITCNYDGKNKSRTVIESGVFIGSDSQLVAPVTIGRGAYVAAGATITRDVPSGSLAISREKQRNLEHWVKRRVRIRRGNKKSE